MVTQPWSGCPSLACCLATSQLQAYLVHAGQCTSPVPCCSRSHSRQVTCTALPCMQGNVAALQHQVEELLVEKDQLLKVITEQQHDAATLQDELLQITQLKCLISVLQQQNKQLARELQEQGAKVLSTCDLTSISKTARSLPGGDCLT